MARVIPCALAYAAAIFALGFVLGAVRVLAVAPRIGALAAVALELPLMLTASAWLARRLVRRAALTRGQAWAMGLLAFAPLLTAERVLAGLLGRSGAEWLAGLLTPAGLLGLAGQAGFGVMPVILSEPG